MSFVEELYPKQKRLNEIIRKPGCFAEAQELFLAIHAAVHFTTDGRRATVMDRLWGKLGRADFAVMPTKKDVTIAWNLWHITRIEDLTVNFLVNGTGQQLNDDWQMRLGVQVTDTGNAMTDEEIMVLSRSVHPDELKAYRTAVGKNAQRILAELKPEDMKRKADASGIEQIRKAGGVTEHPESLWLLDFWGRKDVAGIITMPVTRHQLGHLNDCFGLKDKIEKKKSFYISHADNM
jgi:hypothetical protein